jgi:hypothetical protein
MKNINLRGKIMDFLLNIYELIINPELIETGKNALAALGAFVMSFSVIVSKTNTKDAWWYKMFEYFALNWDKSKD